MVVSYKPIPEKSVEQVHNLVVIFVGSTLVWVC